MFSSLSLLSPDLCCVNARAASAAAGWWSWCCLAVVSWVGALTRRSFPLTILGAWHLHPVRSRRESAPALESVVGGGGGIGLRESFRTRQLLLLLLLLLLLVVVILMSWQSETCSVLQAVLLRKTSTQAVQNAAGSSDHWKCFTVTGPLHVRMAAATWPAPRPGAWPRRRTPGAPPRARSFARELKPGRRHTRVQIRTNAHIHMHAV